MEPSKKPSSPREMEYDGREPGHQDGCNYDADGRQAEALPQNLRQRLPVCFQAAGEQNEDEGDNAQNLRPLRVIERNPAWTLRTGQHANGDKKDERGNAKVVGRLTGQHAQEQQERRDEKDILDHDGSEHERPQSLAVTAMEVRAMVMLRSEMWNSWRIGASGGTGDMG